MNPRPLIPRTERNAFPDGFREWFYELRTGLWRTRFDREHGVSWRVRVAYTLRTARCRAGLHWPVQWTQGTFGGYVAPDDPHFECACCGFERDPYRAIFWEGGRLHFLFAAYWWLRYPNLRGEN